MNPLTEEALLAVMTREELDELAKSAIEAGQVDPIGKAISGGIAELRLYTDPAELDADQLERLWRALTVPLLYQRRAELPKKHAAEQEWARGVLRAGGGSAAGAGKWGSEPRFNPR